VALEAKGQIIPENDIWIAAVALECDMPLATRDAYFQRVEGLTVIQWQPLKMNAAKEKSLSPLSLTSVRVLLLLVVTFFCRELASGILRLRPSPDRAKSLLQVPQPSWEITTLGSTMRETPSCC
jgi:hypothetical protein